MKTGIVLFAHGSRDPLWHTPLKAVQQRLQAQAPQLDVRCAYLELTPPELPECVQQMIHEGIGRIRILPMFLGMGRHAREDLPQLIEQIRQSHPDTMVEVLPALGEDPRLADLSCQIALDKLN
jgi:sirohydrochlorin cobaltochelatase